MSNAGGENPTGIEDPLDTLEVRSDTGKSIESRGAQDLLSEIAMLWRMTQEAAPTDQHAGAGYFVELTKN